MKYRIGCILFCLSLLSFCAFEICSGLHGGSASAGKIKDGKYYVGEHGHYTEVTRSAFLFSKTADSIAGVSFLVAFAIALDMVLSKRKWGDVKWNDFNRGKKKKEKDQA
jgi:hypothetical protein